MTIEITTAATGSTGAMNEYATYQPELYVDTRIVYTSTSSLLADDDGRVAIDYFKVHFVEGCYNLNIVVATGIEDANGNEYVDYLVHANSAALDLEAVYTITNVEILLYGEKLSSLISSNGVIAYNLCAQLV